MQVWKEPETGQEEGELARAWSAEGLGLLSLEWGKCLQSAPLSHSAFGGPCSHLGPAEPSILPAFCREEMVGGKRKTHFEEFGESVVLLRNEEAKKNFATTGVVLPRKRKSLGWRVG